MFSWAKPKPIHILQRIDPDQIIYIISDLHLGDGTRSDAFMAKDNDLLRFIERVRNENAHLIIAGDAIDFHQAWSMSRVLRAHSKLLGSLSRLADTHGVTYIWGNHDYDISLFKDVLRFDVCSDLEIGDSVLVRHGYEYDTFIGPNLEASHITTRIHHLAERLLNSWIRLPLRDFYNVETRVAFWLFHKYAIAIHLAHKALSAVGFSNVLDKQRDIIQYWSMNQMGDAGCMYEGIRSALHERKYQWIVTGHSHLPGKIEVLPGSYYVNTGSWTFNSTQYARWDGDSFEVRDWVTNRLYDDRVYQPLHNRRHHHMNFLSWWRENYLGHFRYRRDSLP